MPDSSITQFSSLSQWQSRMAQPSGHSLGDWENPALAFTVPHPSCVSPARLCSPGLEGAEDAQPLFKTWALTTSLWCPHLSGVLKHFFLCSNTFDSALASFLPGSSGSPLWAQLSTCWSTPALFTPSALRSQMDLKAQIHSLFSMVLVLASHQSIFYYKILTHNFYMYFKLWGGIKKEQE